MKSISLLTFSSNDGPEEPKRVGLFLDSIIAQDSNDWELLFLDLSDKNPFVIPSHPNIKIFRQTPYNGKSYPCYYRNWLATQSQSPLIGHINADCVYSPNFVSTMIKECHTKRLCMCQRKNTSQDEFRKIHTLQDAYEWNKRKTDLHGQGCCGDCQVIERSVFMYINGYFGTIINGEVSQENWKRFAYREDSWLWMYSRNENWNGYPFSNKPKVMQEHWVTDKMWILHLFHEERKNIQQWRQ